MILDAAVFFGAVAAATTLAALVPRAITARIWVGLPLGAALVGAAATLASLIGVGPAAANLLAASGLIATAVVRAWQRRWSWLGAQLFATGVLAAIAYLYY